MNRLLPQSRKIKKQDKEVKKITPKKRDFADDKIKTKRFFTVMLNKDKNNNCILKFIDIVYSWSKDDDMPQLKDFVIEHDRKQSCYEITLHTVKQMNLSKISLHFQNALYCGYAHEKLEKARNLEIVATQAAGNKYFRLSRQGFTADNSPQAMLVDQLFSLFNCFKLAEYQHQFKYMKELKRFKKTVKTDDDEDEVEDLRSPMETEEEETHAEDINSQNCASEEEEEHRTASDDAFVDDDDDDESDGNYEPPVQTSRTKRAQAPPQQLDFQQMFLNIQQMLQAQQQRQFQHMQDQMRQFQENLFQEQLRTRVQNMNIEDPDALNPYSDDETGLNG